MTDTVNFHYHTCTLPLTPTRGKLAPISGSIDLHDASPLAAAIRELREETQLNPDDKDLTLHLQGKLFSIEDHAIGRKWTVHPFSWLLKDRHAKDRIAIDWEHSGFEWLPPEDILSGKHEHDSVPNLAESLWRVWLGCGSIFGSTVGNPAGTRLSDCLSKLQSDHESGAKVMTTHALQYLGEIVSLCDGASELLPGMDLWKQTRMIAWHLIYNGRESMNAAIATTLLRCLETLLPYQNDKKALTDAIERYSESRQAASQQIGEAFAGWLREYLESHGRTVGGQDAAVRILTLSSSSTILSSLQAAIRKYPDLHFDIRILESRPRCEGAKLAQNLVQHDRVPANLHVTVATDASAALLARDLDLLLLGADRISSDGHVSNKTGSWPAVLSAKALALKEGREHDMKVVVLSDMEKICKPAPLDAHKEEDNDPEEVVRTWEYFGVAKVTGNSCIDVRNTYFEWVPPDEIDVYLSEQGPISTEQIRKQALYIEQLENGLLDDI